MIDFQEIQDYQNKCKSNVRIWVAKSAIFSDEWEAAIETAHNAWPYWQMGSGATAEEAWARLKEFLDGGSQIHGEGHEVSASDFFAEGVQ